VIPMSLSMPGWPNGAGRGPRHGWLTRFACHGPPDSKRRPCRSSRVSCCLAWDPAEPTIHTGGSRRPGCDQVDVTALSQVQGYKPIMALPRLPAAWTRLVAGLRKEPWRGKDWWPMVKGDSHGPRINICTRCGLEEADCTRPGREEALDS